MNIPITGLVQGYNYKISFTRYFKGAHYNSGFGCTVKDKIISQTNSGLSGLKFKSVKTGDVQGSFTFTATQETMYWVWDLRGVKDGTTAIIKLYNLSIDFI